MSFPKYPAYKGSRVPWIGEVPLTWEVKAFKWLLDSNDGGVWGDDPTGEGDTLVLRSTDQTVDGNWRIIDPAPRKLSAKEKASALLVEGDLVVTKSSGSSLHIGKTTLVTAEIAQQGYCYGNFMQRLRVNSSFTPKLAWYVMNNELARAQLDLLSNSTTGLANLNGTLIGEIFIPVPTVAEQTQIARFLDHETARIDALIKEQQRLIELLKEKRQAVISHAVTKGLDPMVPMKDSGVEWLGEVPTHWESWKVSHAYGELGSGTTPPTTESEWYENGTVPWVTTGELRESVILETKKLLSPKALSAFPALRLHPAGSLAIAMYGATIGRLGILGVDATVNQACCLLIRPNYLHVKFTFYWLLVFKKSIIDLFASGGGQPNINQEIIANLKIPAPGVHEQAQIARFLDHETARIDALIEEQQRLIELLKEKRQAVISHAVTKGLDPTAPMKDSGVEWLGEVPAHWVVSQLKFNTLEMQTGPFGSQLHAEDYIDGGIPLVNPAHMINGKIIPEPQV